LIVLDTHTLIWWVNGDDKLSHSARNTIELAMQQDQQILVSAITAWEIALLIEKERLSMSMELSRWITLTEQIENLHYIAITHQLGIESVQLPGTFHADPVDRMITALARSVGAPLITADQRIQDYPHVKTIW